MTVAVPEPRDLSPASPTEFVVDDRAVEAHSMHLAGHSWSVIAARVGYASPRVCSMAVTAYLQRAAVEQAPDQRRRALELECARLDALQAPFWDRALAGDLKAAALVLKIISERSHLLALGREAERLEGGPTLIISGDKEQYIPQLKAIVEKDAEALERHWPGSSASLGTRPTPPDAVSASIGNDGGLEEDSGPISLVF